MGPAAPSTGERFVVDVNDHTQFCKSQSLDMAGKWLDRDWSDFVFRHCWTKFGQVSDNWSTYILY